MSARIPEIIDPIFLAEKRRTYERKVALLKLSRLSDRVNNLENVVTFQLDFTKIGKLSVIKGVIRAKIQLECQSCLQFMDIEVNSDVKLAIVASDEEAALIPGDYEPLLCNDEKITFIDIIEDEVLLSLPAIPKHDYDCFERQEPETIIENKGQSSKDSPFSVLSNFKKTGA
jgi:uncharacterized protein